MYIHVDVYAFLHSLSLLCEFLNHLDLLVVQFSTSVPLKFKDAFTISTRICSRAFYGTEPTFVDAPLNVYSPGQNPYLRMSLSLILCIAYYC